MKLKKVACLGLAAMVALGALGCGSDNKAADNKAGSKITGSVTGSGSSAPCLWPRMQQANLKQKIRMCPSLLTVAAPALV